MLDVPQSVIDQNVQAALKEDIGTGDISAQLIPENAQAQGVVICRESAVISGKAWVERSFHSVDFSVQLEWLITDGEMCEPNQPIFRFSGPARALLTAERTALNFLQTLSGTATRCRRYADLVEHTNVQLLDTRKTLPGLRMAQKYAVTCGGCYNHRIGLFDAFLIKENHIMACGSITQAISKARDIAPDKPIEVEVENMEEFDQAVSAGANIIMLDNFELPELSAAVGRKPSEIKLEASGGINDATLVPIAETGVDYISIGTLTKDCQSVDLSMRFG